MDTKEFLEKIKDLPTISSVANQINIESKKESLTAKSLSAIIARDPSLTSKVLKLSNSAYYGLVKQVDTLDRAVTVLGFNAIKSLALTVSVYKFFKRDSKGGEFDIKGLWDHCLGCAVAAKVLVSVANPKLEEQAFVSGILHDVGKIAIAQYLPDEMSYIIGLIDDLDEKKGDRREGEIEQEVLGFTHQKIGGRVATQWNFPDEYINTIKFHHGPFTAKLDEDAASAALARSVCIGNQLAKVMGFGKSTDQSIEKIPMETWQALSITKRKIPELRDKIKADHEKIMESWDLD